MLDYRESKGISVEKKIYLCFIGCAKVFGCVDHDKLWKDLRQTGLADHLTYPLRNMYVDQEAKARTLYGTNNWFKIEKEL